MEAAALSEMAENIGNMKGFRVPSLYWEASGRRVLTMQWVDGFPVFTVRYNTRVKILIHFSLKKSVFYFSHLILMFNPFRFTSHYLNYFIKLHVR